MSLFLHNGATLVQSVQVEHQALDSDQMSYTPVLVKTDLLPGIPDLNVICLAWDRTTHYSLLLDCLGGAVQ